MDAKSSFYLFWSGNYQAAKLEKYTQLAIRGNSLLGDSKFASLKKGSGNLIRHDDIIYINMTLRKVGFSAFLLALATYIFLPTPDEIVIYPVAGLFLTYALHISFVYAVLLITLLYYGAGVVSLLGALLVGGKPLFDNLKDRYRKRRV